MNTVATIYLLIVMSQNAMPPPIYEFRKESDCQIAAKELQTRMSARTLHTACLPVPEFRK